MKASLLQVTLVASSLAIASVGGPIGQTRSSSRIERLYSLASDEGVYAYARISPDGKLLAYASQRLDAAGNIFETVVVINVATGHRLLSEPGIDAYWSPDGSRLIYLSRLGDRPSVTIWERAANAFTRDVAPEVLGDYYSWSRRDGRNLILTIKGVFFHLDDMFRAVLPAAAMDSCDSIGEGERPLISKDGRRASVFVDGELVVRNLTDCKGIIRTGVRGGKADFSGNGRYLAFHTPKVTADGYEIVVVDLVRRTMRTVTQLPGSALFPSWTEDGRLCFRYDSRDFRGFVMAHEVLANPERPLPSQRSRHRTSRWADVFADPAPTSLFAVTLVWAPWSAHAAAARRAFRQLAVEYEHDPRVQLAHAVEPLHLGRDFRRHGEDGEGGIPEVAFTHDGFLETEAVNQVPTTLLFENAVLVDRRLGAQTLEELRTWLDVYISRR